MADPLVRETQKLYGLPLSQFTAARNARAKTLKKKGEAEVAGAGAAGPKPAVEGGGGVVAGAVGGRAQPVGGGRRAERTRPRGSLRGAGARPVGQAAAAGTG